MLYIHFYICCSLKEDFWNSSYNKKIQEEPPIKRKEITDNYIAKLKDYTDERTLLPKKLARGEITQQVYLLAIKSLNKEKQSNPMYG